jgi:hypothetical protein
MAGRDGSMPVVSRAINSLRPAWAPPPRTHAPRHMIYVWVARVMRASRWCCQSRRTAASYIPQHALTAPHCPLLLLLQGAGRGGGGLSGFEWTAQVGCWYDTVQHWAAWPMAGVCVCAFSC